MTKTWLYSANEKTYTIELKTHFSGRREVKINGLMVLDHTPHHNLASNYDFAFDSIPYKLVISRGYLILKRTYELYANDSLISSYT